MIKRVVDNTWDYRNVNTKEYSHGLHSYPAMMIPQVARRLINEYGKNAKVLCDPFLGSASVLVEGMLHNSIQTLYGIEINPLGILISKAKTNVIALDTLQEAIVNLKADIVSDIKKYNLGKLKPEIPSFANIDFWFAKDIQNYLSIIKVNIMRTRDEKIKEFLLVCFSEIIRNVSYTRNGEFKLYRMDKKAIDKHNPNVIPIFFDKLDDNFNKYSGFFETFKALKKKVDVNILSEDTRRKTSIPPNSVDLLVTSPPYGDSRTTVAYGQFSRLSSEWLGYDKVIVRQVDKKGLGGIRLKELHQNLKSDCLNNTIKLIEKTDPERAKDVLAFYEDFDHCVDEINRFMKNKGIVCMVVGNRTVKNVWIETDKIIAELFSNKHNYKHLTTIVREIPSKKMPKSNSPTNVKGQTVTTMNNEYIVILEKP